MRKISEGPKEERKVETEEEKTIQIDWDEQNRDCKKIVDKFADQLIDLTFKDMDSFTEIMEKGKLLKEEFSQEGDHRNNTFNYNTSFLTMPSAGPPEI